MEYLQREMLITSLDKFKTCKVVVNGTSMWPFIKNGDTVTIRNKLFKPSIGKVVAFFLEDQLIIHRIISYKYIDKGTWELLIHGDSSPFSLIRIKSDQVIGTVENIKRKNMQKSLWFVPPYQYFTIPVGIVLHFLVLLKLVISGNKKRC